MSDFDKFQIYYEEYVDKVYAYVNSRTGYRKQLSEDLVSEIFLKALEKFDTFSESEGSFSAWIFRITKNHLIDHYRSNSRKQTSSLDDLENVLESKQNTSKKAKSAMEVEKLQEMMQDLPPKKQEIVTLKYISGYSYKEIAEITGIEENTVRVTAHRTLKELKRKLFELEYEAG